MPPLLKLLLLLLLLLLLFIPLICRPKFDAWNKVEEEEDANKLVLW